MNLKWIRCLFHDHKNEFVENCCGPADERGLHKAVSLWRCSHCGREFIHPFPISRPGPRELTPDEISHLHGQPVGSSEFTRDGYVPKPAPWPPAPPPTPTDDGIASMAAITSMFQMAEQLASPSPSDQPSEPFSSGGGGDYGGGGASASWEASSSPEASPCPEPSPPPSD